MTSTTQPNSKAEITINTQINCINDQVVGAEDLNHQITMQKNNKTTTATANLSNQAVRQSVQARGRSNQWGSPDQ